MERGLTAKGFFIHLKVFIMVNLATLIGVKNLETIHGRPENTYLVIENNGKFDFVKKEGWGDLSKVVGIGSLSQCSSLSKYLSLQQLTK